MEDIQVAEGSPNVETQRGSCRHRHDLVELDTIDLYLARLVTCTLRQVE